MTTTDPRATARREEEEETTAAFDADRSASAGRARREAAAALADEADVAAAVRAMALWEHEMDEIILIFFLLFGRGKKQLASLLQLLS